MRLLITLKSKWYGYFDHFCFEIVLYNARRSFLSIIDVQPPWEKSTRLPSLRKYLHPTRTHAPPPICHYIRQQPKRDSFFDSTSDEGSMGTTIGRIRTIFHLDAVIRSFWETCRFIKDISFSRFINDSALRSRMTELTTNRGAPSSITCYTGADRGGKLRAHLQTRHHPCRHPFLDSGWIGGT